jgi:hypothetical protein
MTDDTIKNTIIFATHFKAVESHRVVFEEADSLFAWPQKFAYNDQIAVYIIDYITTITYTLSLFKTLPVSD